MKKGFTLIELLIVVAIIAILAAIAIPNFLQAQIRAKVSRAKADMRSMATAIESYYVDYNAYPACTAEKQYSIASQANIPDTGFCTFRYYDPDTDPVKANGLTTPVAYMSTIPFDPFATKYGKNVPFRYYSCRAGTPLDPDNNSSDIAQATGWITVSYGPDQNEDIKLDSSVWSSNLYTDGGSYTATSKDLVVDPDDDFTSVAELSYDPTNGTTSPGDIFRVRQ